jgi:3-oxoacyl-[acyl-carrier-protein] synthase II
MDAIADAGLPESAVGSPRCGVSFGSSAGSAQTQEEFFRRTLLPDGGLTLKGVPSSVYLHFMSHTCAANLAIVLHAQGPVVASSTACVSGSQGVGFGYEQIRLGRAEIMLSGGAEEMHHMDAAIFDIMLATSTHYNDRPEASPRPFDADRDGLVVGEGAGCLVLEEYEYARRRGAPIYAEVLGYGTNADGYNMTNANPDGITGAIVAALADAELAPHRIDYINAHATATKIGDLTEAVATRRILGEKTPISCLKGYMGHTLGAAGAIEAIATVLMMRDNFAAPTLKCDNPDPKCGPLNHILREPRDLRIDIAMSNNFAFGGLNTSLIFGKV